jgi:hypothetical protein
LTSFWILWAFLVMMRCSSDYPRPTYPLLPVTQYYPLSLSLNKWPG